MISSLFRRLRSTIALPGKATRDSARFARVVDETTRNSITFPSGALKKECVSDSTSNSVKSCAVIRARHS
eukprot:6207690-Pleurochrysis_carterae.AAC.1